MTAPAPRILLVMGVSGAGKTTVGRRLAAELGWPFYDGDDFHPPENVRKMATGTPLDDEDRGPWLRRIRELMDRHVAEGRPAVVACSALKRSYREVLRAPGVQVVYLKGSEELIAERLGSRQGHYMPPGLLRSQLDTLEEPEDALVLDVSRPVAALVEDVLAELGLGGVAGAV